MENNHMDIKSVYIGYNKFIDNEKKDNSESALFSQLFRVHLVKNSNRNDLNYLSTSVNLKSYNNLPNLSGSYENLSKSQNRFFLNSNSVNNPDLSLFIRLFNVLYSDSKNKMVSVNSLKNVNDLYHCKYVIYLGDDKRNYPIMAAFPFKNNYTFNTKKASFFSMYKLFGDRDSIYFKHVKTGNIFRLPLDSDDNVAKFYKLTIKNKESYKLLVYSSSKFNKIFNIRKMNLNLAKVHLRAFMKKDFLLAGNEVYVRFSNFNKIIQDMKDMYNKKTQYLINSVALFKNNGNSIIKEVNRGQLKVALKTLKIYSKKHKRECHFDESNIPTLNGKKLEVSSNSMPIFCSLLRNAVAIKLLNNEMYIPYYK